MNINDSLKKEIDDLNKRTGLSTLLKKYGKLHTTGSYVYDLMAWRDYDVVLELSELKNSIVYTIVNEVGTIISPDELKILKNIDNRKSNRPTGYWVGIYIDSWKIDLWIMDSYNAKKEVENTTKINSLLKDINKEELIRIKQELSKDKDYHVKFSSVDLYNSYIYGNVRSVKEFYRWLSTKN